MLCIYHSTWRLIFYLFILTLYMISKLFFLWLFLLKDILFLTFEYRRYCNLFLAYNTLLTYLYDINLMMILFCIDYLTCSHLLHLLLLIDLLIFFLYVFITFFLYISPFSLLRFHIKFILIIPLQVNWFILLSRRRWWFRKLFSINVPVLSVRHWVYFFIIILTYFLILGFKTLNITLVSLNYIIKIPLLNQKKVWKKINTTKNSMLLASSYFTEEFERN